MQLNIIVLHARYRSHPGQRVEEGVLVLSKLSVLHSEVLLLPRDLGDPSDDHQRVVLRVQVDAG